MKGRLSPDPAFGRLAREISRFANHTQRLYRASERWRAELELAALWSEGAAPIRTTPDDPGIALRAIDKFARVHRHDRAEMLGAYFAYHHLRIQAMHSRDLFAGFVTVPDAPRAERFHRVLRRADETRRAWVGSLLELTLLAAAPDLSRTDFAAFNVGALTDHEDVDLAIVVPNAEAQAALAKGFATVSRTFVRYAAKLQMFLTEELKVARSGARIDEYAELLVRPDRSVVSVMQLLGAQFLCGHEPLARALEDRVIRKYYAGQGSPIIHESFLRGVMAELRYFLLRRSAPGVLSPKRDLYVPAKLVITALRVTYGVEETLPAEALKLIAKEVPELAGPALTLSDAFAENEVLRALLFLYVFPSDELDLHDPSVREAGERVALLMGLGRGKRGGPDRLQPAFVAMRERALKAVAALATKLEEHLVRVSTFRRIVERQGQLGPLENLVLHLLEGLERFEGSVFWQEVIDPLAQNRALGERYADDLYRLSTADRNGVARRYVRMLADDPPALIDFLVLLSRLDRLYPVDPPRATAEIFWDAMLDQLGSDRAGLVRFTDRLDTETTSDSLFLLAVALPPWRLGALADLLDAHELGPAGFRVARALRSVIILAHHQSNSLGRIASRVLARQPEFLPRLGDARRLDDLSREIGSEAQREKRPRERVELLGDALDVASLRAALSAILEGAPAARDAEHTRAVDDYVRDLWKACQLELIDTTAPPPGSLELKHLSLYATGGYGRSEAFGADWDYLAIIDEPDPALEHHYGRLIQRVSAAMTRRGLHPHNRLTDHFSAYVVTIPGLVKYFGTRTPETFIDEAEVLEARLIQGDPAVARRFEEEIRGPVVAERKRPFVEDVLAELKDRRTRPPRGLNVKLGPGGLREIHLLWLAIRVVAGLPGPLVDALLPEAIAAMPEAGEDLLALMDANRELRKIRDLYRLVVAIDDAMEPSALVEVAADLEPLRHAGFVGGFEVRLKARLADTSARVDRVARALSKRIRDRS